MFFRRLPAIVVVMGAILSRGEAVAHPPACHPAACHPAACQVPPLTGGYGNAGFSSGYSSWISGIGTGCGPVAPAWGPCWRPCIPRYCLPRRCLPRPCWGWGGWYGSSRSAWSESVYLAAPFGGGGFFSGGVNSFVVPYAWSPWGYGWGSGYGCGPVYGGPFITPYGTWLPAGYAPTFGPAGVLPFLNAFGADTAPTPAWRTAVAAPPRPHLVATDRQPAVRVSNADARRRALALVAVGDRHMRAAVAAPGKLTNALDAYRRAGTVAPDLPDTFVRQAIALVALERHDAASRALDRVAAIDSRLAAATADRGLIAIREIWTNRDADALPPAPGLGALAAAPAATRDPAAK